VGDYNGDGKTDFLFTWTDGTWWVGLSDGAHFNFTQFYQNPGWGSVIAAGSPARTYLGDYNGDGKTDFLFTWMDGTLWVGLSDGAHFNFSPFYGNAALGPLLAASSDVRSDVGDFNGDGKTDFQYSAPDGNLWVGLSDGAHFNFSVFYANKDAGPVLARGSSARSFVADVNGDGKSDYLFAYSDGGIWLGTSDGAHFRFTQAFKDSNWAAVLPQTSQARMFVADFTGDRRADVLFTWPDGNCWLGVSDGVQFKFGVLAAKPEFGAEWKSDSPARATVADVNGDGKADFIFTWTDGSWWVGK
jgi:hypothetical protein